MGKERIRIQDIVNSGFELLNFGKVFGRFEATWHSIELELATSWFTILVNRVPIPAGIAGVFIGATNTYLFKRGIALINFSKQLYCLSSNCGFGLSSKWGLVVMTCPSFCVIARVCTPLQAKVDYVASLIERVAELVWLAKTTILAIGFIFHACALRVCQW